MNTSNIQTAVILGTPITLVVIGLFVFCKNPREKVNQLFGCLSLALALANIGDFLALYFREEPALALLAYRISSMGTPAIIWFWIQFNASLANDTPPKPARWTIHIMTPLLSLMMLSPLIIEDLRFDEGGFSEVRGPAYFVFRLYLLWGTSYGIYRLVQLYQHVHPTKRIQLQYLICAFIMFCLVIFSYALGTLPILAGILSAAGIHVYFVYYSFEIGYSILVAYAILQHGAMDIRTVVHKTFMWLATFSLALIPVLVTVLPAKHVISNLTHLQLSALISAYFVFLVVYIKTVQPRIDHFFQRRKYDMQKILHGMVRELALLKDLTGLTQKIAATIREALYVSHSSIILWDKNKQEYSNINRPGPAIDLSIHSRFLDWMKREDRIIDWNEIETEPLHKEIRTSARNYFEALSAKIALPLVHNDHLIGVINLGEKDNLNLFTRSDIEFLSTLRAQSTIALSNSLLYEDVHKMSEQLRHWALELEEKVALRTEELSERTQELSKSKAALECSYQKLQELDFLKSQFFANISHEFRTPLTLILAPLESFLNRPDIPEDQRKHFHIMYQNGLRLLKLINNLLDLAKIDAGTMLPAYSKTDLAMLMKGVASSLTFLAEKKQLHLSFEEKEGPLAFYFDRDKIEKVLLNLIFNAVKFTEPGGRIDLSCEEREGRVLVKVSDTGIGIAGEDLPKLFNRFTQIDPSSSRRHEGSGIGLALCKEWVGLHQGKIWAESEVGKGTVFSFTLPCLTERPPSEQSIDTIPQDNLEEDWIRSLHKAAEYAEGGILQEPPTLPEQAPTEGERKPKILVIEDNPDMLHYIASQLYEEYQILPARNGVEGIERAKAGLPDLILADVMMPIKDGYQLCREIKEDLTTRHIPIVLVTAKADLSMKIEGWKQGADDYLTKPFSSEELRARVKSLLNLRTLEKEIQIRNQALERTLSELKQTQTQLIHSEKMAAMGTLVAGLSHELNNPLTGVIGFAEILLSLPLSKEAHQFTENIFREGRRCAAIVRSLADFARKAPPRWQSTDLNTLIHAVLELKTSYLRTDNIAVTLQLDPHLPKTLVDDNQIKQVLLNLLNNAHQAVLMNETDRTIRIVSEQTGGLLRITLSDNGPGIPKEVQPRIFEPFFTTKPEGEGTGLGLSISYGIIHSHGGKIQFFSEEGIGTRFWFELPIRTSSSPPSHTPADLDIQYQNQNKRALVVDDEPMVLKVCKTALEQVGFYVDTLQSGEAALEQLTKASYDLLVSDVRMPGMNGIQFLEQVGRVYPEILERTILMTGDAANSVTSAFLERTHATVLEKPFDLKKLQHLARSILERNSTQRWNVE